MNIICNSHGLGDEKWKTNLADCCIPINLFGNQQMVIYFTHQNFSQLLNISMDNGSAIGKRLLERMQLERINRNLYYFSNMNDEKRKELTHAFFENIDRRSNIEISNIFPEDGVLDFDGWLDMYEDDVRGYIRNYKSSFINLFNCICEILSAINYRASLPEAHRRFRSM